MKHFTADQKTYGGLVLIAFAVASLLSVAIFGQEAKATSPYATRWMATLVNVSASGVPAAFTPASGKTLTVNGYCLSGSAAGVTTLKIGTSGSTLVAAPTAAGGQCTAVDLGNNAVNLGSVGSTVNVALSVAGSVSGIVYGTQQ